MKATLITLDREAYENNLEVDQRVIRELRAENAELRAELKRIKNPAAQDSISEPQADR
jgi:dephospho-CoA kinase